MDNQSQHFDREVKKARQEMSQWKVSLWLTFFIFVCGSFACGAAAAFLIPGPGLAIAAVAVVFGVLVFIYQIVRVQVHKSRLEQGITTLQGQRDMAAMVRRQQEMEATGKTPAPADE